MQEFSRVTPSTVLCKDCPKIPKTIVLQNCQIEIKLLFYEQTEHSLTPIGTYWSVLEIRI